MMSDDWYKNAACRGKAQSIFFPERGDNESVKEAKALCASCPVQRECLAESAGFQGIWAGQTERERRGLTRGRTCVWCGARFTWTPLRDPGAPPTCCSMSCYQNHRSLTKTLSRQRCAS